MTQPPELDIAAIVRESVHLVGMSAVRGKYDIRTAKGRWLWIQDLTAIGAKHAADQRRERAEWCRENSS